MGILSATVVFSTTPPTPTELVATLREHTGELVSYDEYDEQQGILSCPATNDAAGLDVSYGGPEKTWQSNSWELLNHNLEGGYLWYATLIVLQRLGGTCDWQIPSWAFKPWHLAKREQKRWFARRFTYTEARRLGVE